MTEVKGMRVRACVLQRHVWGEASSEDPVSKWGCFCETPGGRAEETRRQRALSPKPLLLSPR